MEQITRVWESLKNVGSIVDVFEDCIDLGLNITDAKKIASRWQRKNGGASGVFF